MKTFSLEPTRDKKLFRVTNVDGEWERYYYAPKKLYLDSVTHILDMGYAKGTGLINFFKKHTAEEAEDILNTAGEKGSRIHRAIEMTLTPSMPHNPIGGLHRMSRDMAVYNRRSKVDEKLSTAEWNALLSFGNFWVKHAPEIVAIEESVYNLKYGYAGTLDAILILTKACEVKICPCKDLIGKVGIFDWKSSKGLYPSYAAQIASYGNATSLKRILGGKKPEYTALLRIGTQHKTTGGYEFVAYNKEETHTNWDLFLSAIKISKNEIKPFDPDKEVFEIPDEITLAVSYKPLVEDKPKKTNDTKVKRVKRNPVQDKKGRAADGGAVRSVLQAEHSDTPAS